MGSAQSLLSPEAAVTTAVVVGAIGYGIGYQVSKSDSDEKMKESSGDGKENKGASGKKGGKNKKEKAGAGAATSTTSAAVTGSTPTVVPFPAVVPGQFDDDLGSASASGLEASGSAATGKKSKAKKKKKAAADDAGEPSQSTAAAEKSATPDVVVQQLASSDPGPQKSKKQKKKKAQSQGLTPTQSQELPSKPNSQLKASDSLHHSTISVDTDGEWTRVESRPKKNKQAISASESTQLRPAATTSASDNVSVSTGDALTTGTSEEGDGDAEDEGEEEQERSSKNAQGQRRPLAERLLPKPRKTHVEDMLETPDHPTVSRVMRIQPNPGEKPAAGFSWGDYEDVDQGPGPSGGETGDGEGDDDEGWGVVKRGGRPRPERSTNLSSSSTSQHGPIKAPESMTKKQRQNARKREEQKAAKAEQEKQRLATVSQHKRTLEQERMKEQNSKKGGGKSMSGGMQASVDEKGKLVWE
ncbi:hypothetical protein AAF712_006265 [Marasmius tenuissimus]|uniref:Uncharacterized protein n=1 Tax=Marasmius tenuissimus TaxID=585030 RepID=A0ABR2ZY86_9AGAR